MRTFLTAVLLSSFASIISAQTASTQTSSSPGSTPPQVTPYAVIGRDANNAVWQRTEYEQDSTGEWVPRIHKYVETATGLNFFDVTSGSWQPSVEDIEPTAGGASALQGQHKVIFAADLATTGAIQLQMPDGQKLQTELLGLCYSDQASGKTVFIAVVTNCIGEIVGANQVWYENAFTGLKASVHYTYTKAGFEQDVVLEECPTLPEAYGLNSATTVLQAITGVDSAPAASLSSRQISLDASSENSDETVQFPTMMIGHGRAFLIGDRDSTGVAVSKQWTVWSGQPVLVEQIPVSQISANLQTLPNAQASASNFSNSIANVVSAMHLRPSVPVARGNAQPMKFAGVRPKKSGFVLDYITINTSQSNQVFQGANTYYISGNVILFGTNTVFEAGTVLKYANGASLTVDSPLTWLGKPYNPIVLLSKDENAVGQAISGSTGNPGTAYYATTALYFDGTSALTNLSVENLRILNAQTGLALNGQSGHVLNDLQIVNCGNGIVATNTSFGLHNALLSHVMTNFAGNSATGQVEQLTSDVAVWLSQNIGSNLFFTNCLLTAVTNHENWNTDYVQNIPTNNGIYQVAGAGSYYLPTNSPYLGAGTNNISLWTLSALQQKTTYAPFIYSNQTISATELGPNVLRDTGMPALGYHYDPLDWVFGGSAANSNLTFDAGTAVGYFETASASYGIELSNHITNSFNGTVTAPCVFARYSTIQEGNGNWKSKGTLAGITTVGNSSYYGEVDAKFTHFYGYYGDPNYIRDYLAKLDVYGNECEFNCGDAAGYWLGLFMTNCLFDRVADIGSIQNSDGIVLRNCTMHEGLLYALHSGYPNWPVWIENSAFDNTTNAMDDPVTNFIYCAYNAFLNGAAPLVVTNAHDEVTNSFTWQTGPLGFFYQPTNSFLINAGSVTADLVGLYHFTTQTNQTIEGSSQVDIGYHYVALDSNGNPIDTNGDGIADYLEDSNGDGIYDAGDLGNWLVNPWNGLVPTNGLQVFTPLK